MTPTFGSASLPPVGAFAPWGGPAALNVTPTFGSASLPPAGAFAPWGGPAALNP